jgi:uncharacterized protein (TIGR03086 family)
MGMPSDLRPGPDSPPTDEFHSAEAALGALQRVLHPIASDELSRPTPCPEFDVAKLTDHLLNSISMVGGAVDAQIPERSTDDSVERQIIAAARPTMDALRRRGLDRTATLGGNEMPVRMLAGILSIEFLVHAWDYAVATGHPVDVADSMAYYVLGLAEEIITPQARSTAGFADPVEAPAESSALERLVGFTGRHPAR